MDSFSQDLPTDLPPAPPDDHYDNLNRNISDFNESFDPKNTLNGNVLSVNPDSIPNQLKQFNNWVVWRLETRNGKNTKIPYQINGVTAKVNDSSTWTSFDLALSAQSFSGIGFIVKTNINGLPLIGIDVDYPFDSILSQEVIEKFQGTYCEKSPSSKLRIFVLGQKNTKRNKGIDSKIEIYDDNSPRYLTVTGHHIEGTAFDITEQQDSLNWLIKRFFTKTNDKPLPLPQTPVKTQSTQPADNVLSDDQILKICQKAKNSTKFNELFNGGGPKDQSSGDFGLARIFTFYAKSSHGQGIDQLDRLMRQSQRQNILNGKWDKQHASDGRTYGQITCQKAFHKQSDTYKPTKSSSLPQTPVKTQSTQPAGNDSITHSEGILSDNQTTQQDNSLECKWHDLLAFSERTGYISNLHNMLIAMRFDKNLQIFGFNEFTGKIEKTKASEVLKLHTGELEDNDITRIRNYFSESINPENSWGSTDTLASIVCIAKERYSFHPVRDYLNSLEWDGTNRLEFFFSDHCGAEFNPYSAFVGKSFFLSLVARIMQPGCKVDTVIILEGDQGIGKSSLFRSLCPNEEWVRDSEIDLNSKDAYTALRGKWIIELAELDSLSKVETTRIKSFITSQVDSYRPPYGKCDVDVPRQCVFVGTTNKSSYLKDESGNRRFLPLHCNSIDLQAIITNRDQVWAEAVVRYRNGEKWYYSKDDKDLFAQITTEQEKRYEGDSWELKIAEFASTHDDFTISDIAHTLGFEIKDIDRRTEIRIGKILQFLGSTRDRKIINGQRRYVYSQINSSTKPPEANIQPSTFTKEEIQSHRVRLLNEYPKLGYLTDEQIIRIIKPLSTH